MTDLELVEMGIKMIKKEKSLMVKKQDKALKVHTKKMEKLSDELDGLMERRTKLNKEPSEKDTVNDES